MAKRGRRSIADLTTLKTLGDSGRVVRPEPPYTLTGPEADEWRAVVDALPADWFPREAWNLLAQRCRHAIQANRIAMLVEQACGPGTEEFDVVEYERLLRMQQRESGILAVLETKLRMTPKSADPRGRRSREDTPRPWETAD